MIKKSEEIKKEYEYNDIFLKAKKDISEIIRKADDEVSKIIEEKKVETFSNITEMINVQNDLKYAELEGENLDKLRNAFYNWRNCK